MITRRSLLIRASALALSSHFSRAVAQRNAKRIRYNVATPEGRRMLRTYAQGVSAMKALRPQDPRSWTFQWNIHTSPQPKARMLDAVFPDGSGDTFELASETWSTCQSHQHQPTDYFLPWHRLYVMHFEEIVRVLTRQDDFTLPYWDYTSSSSYAIPEEFQSRNRNDRLFSTLFMSNRNKDGGSYSAADVNAGEPLNKHHRGRFNFLLLPNLREPNYSIFCNQLDTKLHNLVHKYVGDSTNMGEIPTAAGDPLFWVHHCNIDRIWASWNASGGRNPASTNGSSWDDTSFVFASSEGERVEVNIGAIGSNEALPYTYDSLPVAAPGAAIASASPQPEVLLKSVGVGAAASNSPQLAGSVTLGWVPVKVALAPTGTQNRLLSVAARMQSTAPAHLVLRFRGVRTNLDPDTAYRIFLDLPENASDDVQEQHYIGLLVFFEMGPDGDHAMHAGRDIEFDVTDLVRDLGRFSALQDQTSITIAPVGASAASSMPMVSGGIELVSR